MGFRLLCIALAACHGSTPADDTGSDAGPTVGVFMVPSDGDNVDHCTFELPCDSFTVARAEVQALPAGERNAYLMAGTYRLTSTLAFVAADSGSASDPIAWQCYPGQACTITGAQQVVGLADAGSCGAGCEDFTTTLDGTTTRPFESLWYNGVRRARPQARGTNHGYLANACPLPPSGDGNVCVAGPTISDADAQCGCTHAVTDAGGHCAAIGGAMCPAYECFNKYEYAGSDVDGAWHGANIGDVELLLFEDWTMARMRLASATTGVATFTGPTQTSLNHGCQAGHYYIAENVKENAAPGEWYLDRCPHGCPGNVPEARWTLHVYADTSIAETPETADVEIPQLDPVAPALVSWTGVSDQVWRSITFAGDNWMPSALGDGDSSGMPNVTGALVVTASTDLDLDGISIVGTTGWAMDFEGAVARDTVENSVLEDLGAGGIRIGSATVGAVTVSDSDSDATVPQYLTIQNNLIAYGGRVQPSGEGPAISLGDGHHNTFTHNEIKGFYTGGINLGYGLKRGSPDGSQTTNYFIHDNVVSFNLISDQNNALLSDHGGIHAAVSLSSACPESGACNTIANNVIHDIYNDYDLSTATLGTGARGIYLDQGNAHVLVQSNLVYRVGQSCVFNNNAQGDGPNRYLAQGNVYDNNVFASCGYANPQFAYHSGAVVARDGSGPDAFAWTHNVATVNTTPMTTHVQGLAGGWACFASFWLQYTGSAKTVTAAIGGGAITLSSPVAGETHTLALAQTPTLAEVIAAINQLPGYSAGKTADLDDATPATALTATTANIAGTLYADSSFAAPCSDFFGFDHNAWWSTASDHALTFATCKTAASCQQGLSASSYNIFKQSGGIPAAWTALGEDTGSIALDPAFANPTYPVDDFHVSSDLSAIGFVPFDSTLAGRTSSGPPAVDSVPDPFPVRPVDPANDF